MHFAGGRIQYGVAPIQGATKGVSVKCRSNHKGIALIRSRGVDTSQEVKSGNVNNAYLMDNTSTVDCAYFFRRVLPFSLFSLLRVLFFTFAPV